ncbi:uncharacterized protein LOC105446878 isoform X2 [Strongylocentrotus purpuratus]|uniref:Uncharacterized protein n=1 Tax=Strongylocentrotus purpuratus TaxID=7668 RepID=A0A7M7PQD4_STRPU|nr:uncharacterized protein LOC105446878 isoform X2 [Strongylocentrotus purpuratus]
MSSKMEHKPRRLYFLEIMSTRKNVIVVVGIIVLLILINLGFVLRGLLDISSDPVYKPKARFRNEEQDERISTIGTLYDSVINLSTNAPVDKMTSSNIFFMDEQDAIQKARRAQVSHTCIKNSSDDIYISFMEAIPTEGSVTLKLHNEIEVNLGTDIIDRERRQGVT